MPLLLFDITEPHSLSNTGGVSEKVWDVILLINSPETDHEDNLAPSTSDLKRWDWGPMAYTATSSPAWSELDSGAAAGHLYAS